MAQWAPAVEPPRLVAAPNPVGKTRGPSSAHPRVEVILRGVTEPTLDDLLSQPVPRRIDPPVHLLRPRRLVIGSLVVSGIVGLLAVTIFASLGLFEQERPVSSYLILAFLAVTLALPPLWQVSSYRKAQRLLTYGSIVPAFVTLGTPTRGHPARPITARCKVGGRDRCFTFLAGPDPSLLDDAVVLVLDTDAALYVPGFGVIAARVS